MRRFDKHIPILSGLGDWARLRLILGGSNECPPATVSSYTVVVSHLAFGTLSLRSINAPRWRRSWNVWISCSQDGPQGSQHLIRFSVGHFALAQGNPWGDIVLFAPSLVLESSGVTAHCWTSPQESDNFPRFVAVFAIPHRQSVPELCLQVLLGTFCITGTERKIHAKRKHDANRTTRRTRCLGVQVARSWT